MIDRFSLVTLIRLETRIENALNHVWGAIMAQKNNRIDEPQRPLIDLTNDEEWTQQAERICAAAEYELWCYKNRTPHRSTAQLNRMITYKVYSAPRSGSR